VAPGEENRMIWKGGKDRKRRKGIGWDKETRKPS